jgi:hypothetical protein
MYIFGPPGWSHDGSKKTSKQLQAKLKAQKMDSTNWDVENAESVPVSNS